MGIVVFFFVFRCVFDFWVCVVFVGMFKLGCFFFFVVY